jgi:hypothetical protein
MITDAMVDAMVDAALAWFNKAWKPYRVAKWKAKNPREHAHMRELSRAVLEAVAPLIVEQCAKRAEFIFQEDGGAYGTGRRAAAEAVRTLLGEGQR